MKVMLLLRLLLQVILTSVITPSYDTADDSSFAFTQFTSVLLVYSVYTGPVNVTSVSYTHLDVYKRQEMSGDGS